MKAEAGLGRLLFIVSFGCLTVAAGCSAGEVPSPKESPFVITLATSFRPDMEVPQPSNDVERQIEEYTSTQLEIQWIPSFAYEDKVSFMIASNRMPKLMKVSKTGTVVGAAESDVFWELDPYISSYPNLWEQRDYYENIRINGKLYGVPTMRDVARSAFIYRKDWLERLGLDFPRSLESWYEVLKAIRTRDPDGNGLQDTYGIMLDKDYHSPHIANTPLLTLMAVGEGAPHEWGVEEGRIVPDFETDAYWRVMQLFRRLYEEDLINRNFSVLDDARQEFYKSGRSGIVGGAAMSAKIYQEELSRKSHSAALDLEPVGGSGGRRVPGETGNNGFYVMPKSSVPTEKELHKVLGFLNQLLDEPMSTLQLRGVEGIHYDRLPNGKAQMVDLPRFQLEVKPYRDHLLNREGYHVLPLEDNALGLKGREIMNTNDSYLVPNQAYKLYSPAYAEMGDKLRVLIMEAQTKYIMGLLDEEGWRKAIAKWHQSGGDQIIRELQDSYRKLGDSSTP